MILLRDGPGRGSYAVGRAPLFLRAVVSASGKKDVLDQLDDTPTPEEQVYVYRRQGVAGFAIITLARPRRCVKSATGEYAHVPEAVGDDMRETSAWRAWCEAQVRPKAAAL